MVEVVVVIPLRSKKKSYSLEQKSLFINFSVGAGVVTISLITLLSGPNPGNHPPQVKTLLLIGIFQKFLSVRLILNPHRRELQTQIMSKN